MYYETVILNINVNIAIKNVRNKFNISFFRLYYRLYNFNACTKFCLSF